MVFDLFTLSGVILFIIMLAGLIATHRYRAHSSAGGPVFYDPTAR
jgi:hypothetical protein